MVKLNILTWSIKTSAGDSLPEIVSEYVLNDLGIFVKRERRMPKSRPLTAVTGFRVGYTAVPNTDYRAAPLDRNALLWHKITDITEVSENVLAVSGNRGDKTEVFFPPELRDSVLRYIAESRRSHPIVTGADPAAASWICWREDDEWGDPFLPLNDMVENERKNNRFIEPEILALTELISFTPENKQPVCCRGCGSAIGKGDNFCGKCGLRVNL